MRKGFFKFLSEDRSVGIGFARREKLGEMEGGFLKSPGVTVNT